MNKLKKDFQDALLGTVGFYPEEFLDEDSEDCERFDLDYKYDIPAHSVYFTIKSNGEIELIFTHANNRNLDKTFVFSEKDFELMENNAE